MQGIAKTKWCEIYGIQKQNFNPWPFFDELIQKEVFHSTDLYFAKAILQKQETINENRALFLAYLLKSARNGHLCVKIAKDKIEPVLEDFDETAVRKIIEGSDFEYDGYVYKNGDYFYLMRNWNKETQCLEQIQKLIASKPVIQLDTQKLKTELIKHDQQILPEQKNGIISAFTHALTILTGGPGTGKTYTAGHMIKVIWEALNEQQKANFEIVLAAPTGKAASNLQNSLQKALAGLPLADKIHSQTLHSLLKIFGYKLNDVKLTADLILVDECSMIDTHVMSKLLTAVKPGARLILLGDKFQLPSVEIGSIFANCVDFMQNHNEYKSQCVELVTCMRSELQGLVDFAQGIKTGNLNLSRKYEGVKFPDAETYMENPKLLVEFLVQQIKQHDFSEFRILSPLRKGPFGVDALNRQIYQGLCKSPQMVRIPIMITQNHEDTGLFNGDVGVLVSSKDPIQRLFDRTDYALFNGKKIPALLLPNFELAYCMSIHKSQGSEFQKVLLILPEKSEYFGREVFYTAVTRAKQSIEILTTPAILQATLANPTVRLSGLLDRLCSL